MMMNTAERAAFKAFDEALKGDYLVELEQWIRNHQVEQLQITLAEARDCTDREEQNQMIWDLAFENPAWMLEAMGADLDTFKDALFERISDWVEENSS